MAAALGGGLFYLMWCLAAMDLRKALAWRLESQRDKAGGELQAIDRCDGDCG